jgi:hypothetical protein
MSETKNFNPVNRAEFNPGVESSPCNRPLSCFIESGGKRREIDLVNKFSHFLFAKHSLGYQ